jgi:ribosomal protein L37E
VEHTESVSCQCPKCGVQTEHAYTHAPITRRTIHYGKMVVSLLCLCMVYPDIFKEDETTAACSRCGTQAVVPYKV